MKLQNILSLVVFSGLASVSAHADLFEAMRMAQTYPGAAPISGPVIRMTSLSTADGAPIAGIQMEGMECSKVRFPSPTPQMRDGKKVGIAQPTATCTAKLRIPGLGLVHQKIRVTSESMIALKKRKVFPGYKRPDRKAIAEMKDEFAEAATEILTTRLQEITDQARAKRQMVTVVTQDGSLSKLWDLEKSSGVPGVSPNGYVDTLVTKDQVKGLASAETSVPLREPAEVKSTIAK